MCHNDSGLSCRHWSENESMEIDGVDNVDNCGKVIIQTAAV